MSEKKKPGAGQPNPAVGNTTPHNSIKQKNEGGPTRPTLDLSFTRRVSGAGSSSPSTATSQTSYITPGTSQFTPSTWYPEVTCAITQGSLTAPITDVGNVLPQQRATHTQHYSNMYPLQQQSFSASYGATDQRVLRDTADKSTPEGKELLVGTPGYERSLTNSKGKKKAADIEDDVQSIGSNPYPEDSVSQRGNHFSPGSDAGSVGSDSSNASVLSVGYRTKYPAVNDQIPPTWHEIAHAKNWRMQSRAHPNAMSEGIPGAIQIAGALNPDIFRMEWGDRVICIKTDDVEHIFCSVKKGVWAAIDKVGDRINRLWDAREYPNTDRVLLLFSINTQKAYCGLAEMRGPWKVGNVPPEWKEPRDGSKPNGTLPVQWTYVKNVPYLYFEKILHPTSGQIIYNMWNGMHFPSEEARQVIEIYIKRTHFSNVLAYDERTSYSPWKVIEHPGEFDPTLKDKTPSPMTVAAGSSGRAKSSPAVEAGHASHPTPGQMFNRASNQAQTPNNPRRQTPGQGSSTPNAPSRPVSNGRAYSTPPNVDGPASPSPRPGSVVSYFVDAHGNYHPIRTPASPLPTMVPQPIQQSFMPPPGPFTPHRPGMYPQPYSPVTAMPHGHAYSGSPHPFRGRGGPQSLPRLQIPNVTVVHNHYHVSPSPLRHVQSTASMNSSRGQQGMSPRGRGRGKQTRGRFTGAMPNQAGETHTTGNAGSMQQNSRQALRQAASNSNIFVPASPAARSDWSPERNNAPPSVWSELTDLAAAQEGPKLPALPAMDERGRQANVSTWLEEQAELGGGVAAPSGEEEERAGLPAEEAVEEEEERGGVRLE